MDYAKVSTYKQVDVFNKIWIAVWNEKGYELEFTENICHRYLIYDRNIPIGTLELKPYTDASQINDFFPFTNLLSGNKNIIEIDKLALIKVHRSIRNFGKILNLLFEHFTLQEIDLAIGLIEPKLYRLLHMRFGNTFKKISEAFYYKGDNVIPIIVEASKIVKENEIHTKHVLEKYSVG